MSLEGAAGGDFVDSSGGSYSQLRSESRDNGEDGGKNLQAHTVKVTFADRGASLRCTSESGAGVGVGRRDRFHTAA